MTARKSPSSLVAATKASSARTKSSSRLKADLVETSNSHGTNVSGIVIAAVAAGEDIPPAAGKDASASASASASGVGADADADPATTGGVRTSHPRLLPTVSDLEDPTNLHQKTFTRDDSLGFCPSPHPAPKSAPGVDAKSDLRKPPAVPHCGNSPSSGHVAIAGHDKVMAVGDNVVTGAKNDAAVAKPPSNNECIDACCVGEEDEGAVGAKADPSSKNLHATGDVAPAAATPASRHSAMTNASPPPRTCTASSPPRRPPSLLLQPL